jgi:hypothetical protein
LREQGCHFARHARSGGGQVDEIAQLAAGADRRGDLAHDVRGRQAHQQRFDLGRGVRGRSRLAGAAAQQRLERRFPRIENRQAMTRIEQARSHRRAHFPDSDET